MTASALLKKVKEAYPQAFAELPKAKLRLVEKAVVYASKLGATDDVFTSGGHGGLLREATGKTELLPGDRLKAYRLREDLTQVELAKRAGIPQANVSAMEAGRRPIGVQMAKRLAKALGCDFRRLV